MSRTEFVDLYCVQRRTLAEIAAMIGVSRKAAGRLARHHGITPPVRSAPRSIRHGFTTSTSPSGEHCGNSDTRRGAACRK